MAILKNPLLSLGAVGRLAKHIAFTRRRKVNIVESTPIPEDAKTLAQLSWRHMYQKAVALWHALSAAEKQEWESLARPKHMTGYAWFISQALKPNPGLYLPLQGGTMAGNIDMDKNRLLKLPAPTDNQEVATKAYVDALAPGLHAATHENGGADEIDVAGLSGLLADDQHIINAEAVSAMGAKGDANPLHHDKYTNALAIAAAKTIKLDDFATPDDNADLNASIARHGLLKKLSNVATQFMNGVGNWVVPAGEAATKEFFVPVAHSNITSGAKGRYGVRLLDAPADTAYFSFKIPHDFTSLTSVKIIFIGRTASPATIDWTAYVYFAAIGEAYGANSDSTTADGLEITSDEMMEIDLSAAFTGIAADDYVGLQWIIDAQTGTGGGHVLGLVVKYA